MSNIKHYNADTIAALSLILADADLALDLEAYILKLAEAKRQVDEARVAAWFAEDERRDWNRQVIEYDDVGF